MFPPKRGMGVVQNNKMFWVTFGTKTILEFWTEKGCVLTPLGSEIMGGGTVNQTWFGNTQIKAAFFGSLPNSQHGPISIFATPVPQVLITKHGPLKNHKVVPYAMLDKIPFYYILLKYN